MIKRLSQEDYKGYPLHFSYETEAYYEVFIQESHPTFRIEFKRTKFDEKVKKSFDSKLFKPHLEKPTAFGYFLDERCVGILEVNYEAWSNRLRVTELLINPGFRRHGIGKKLMNHAKSFAKEINARALILETQTCNIKAIDFYRAQGFNLIGMDTLCYSNEDIESKEVRVELGVTL